MKALTVVDSTLCGFCNTGNCAKCVIGTVMRKSSRYPEGGVVWRCNCTSETCSKRKKAVKAKCVECGNINQDEVDPKSWACKDATDCAAVVTARRESDPFLVHIEKIRSSTMAKIENEKATAKKAVAKTGTCVCGCKGTTKGGLFLPGHDARFVSTLVGKAESAKFSKASVAEGKKTLKDAGASEKLLAKFDKSVGLAQERVEKKAAAAKAKVDEKAAAKASA